MRLSSAGFPHVTMTTFYALSLTEYHMNMHVHDSCEIMYVTKGCCQVLLEGQTCTLREKEFIFLDADVPHRLLIPAASACSLLNLEFHCDAKKTKTSISIMEAAKESPMLASFLHSFRDYSIGYDTTNLGYAVKDLIFHLEKTLSPSQPTMEQLFMTRLLFFRFLLELADNLTHPYKEAGMVYLKKARTYISDHLMEEIRVPQVAAYAGINKSYLQSLFSRHMKSTVTDYINKKRLEQAAFFLINSSLSITDIAFQCGYNSRQHFAKTFQKFHGCSPKSYRQLHSKSVSASTGSDYYFRTPEGTWSNRPLESS